MDRARRVRTLWSWLPAFRAAAESEHLPTASRALFVSRSALSRTIRMLEEDLGTPLFDRVGRGIRLNAAGHALLAVVRDAMRLVDEGIGEVAGEGLAGPVRISAPPELAGALVLPALGALTRDHPDLVPDVREVGFGEIVPRLLGGALDVALVAGEPPRGERVRALRLATLEHGVYSGPDHPLSRAGSPIDLDELRAHRFVVPQRRGSPLGSDRWPADRPRRIGLVAADVEMALRACRDQPWLAVLPEIFVRSHPLGGALRRLDRGALEPTPLYAVTRAPVGGHPRTEALLAALRHRAEGW